MNGCDVVCVARNDALLDGLLTVFHVERSSDELLNLQNDLPLLSDYDKECIISLAVVSHAWGASEGRDGEQLPQSRFPTLTAACVSAGLLTSRANTRLQTSAYCSAPCIPPFSYTKPCE